MPLWSFLEGGGRRAAAVWHRRAGKDSLAANWTGIAAHERIGTYWHMLPTQKQGRKVVWNNIDKQGRRLIDQAFPPPLRAAKREDEMLIEFKVGSIWQVVGSDNYDSLVGTNVLGVIFSEWALTDPRAWDYIRPILVENDGWAIFIYTARGRNHGARMYEMALDHPDWFAEKLTVDDTEVIAADAIEAEREAGMPEEMIEQEFYCSFEAALVGSFYGKLVNQAEQEKRIGDVPWDPSIPVQTWWDIGRSDATSIWFVQLAGLSIRVIDFYENTGEGADHYAKIVQEKPYTYGDRDNGPGHLLPHDANVTDWSTSGKRSRLEILKSLGLNCRVVPKLSVQDGIQAVRTILPRCWFDRTKCERGLEALRQYRHEWNESLQTFTREPVHDWASHPADAFRYGALGMKEVKTEAPTPRRRARAGGWMGS